ncbi:CAP domain-containing protein [Butyrivibrio sp. AC2005]|uniref:CAP domain-containing protein n=1 Tax=Butyrivibrio sp. AC2005 TaxID=1280672 RepID=UPI0004085A25|nr:CAP domain-containing protein [Butyrivibrio sp. AC2005]
MKKFVTVFTTLTIILLSACSKDSVATSVDAVYTESSLQDNLTEDEEKSINDTSIKSSEIISSSANNDITDATEEKVIYVFGIDDIAASNATENTEPDELEQAILDGINNVRRENGLSELKYDFELEEYAQIRAQEVAIVWSHTRPDGSEWKTVAPGIYRGEILARNSSTDFGEVSNLITGWINSPKHYYEMTQKAFTKAGVGIYHGPDANGNIIYTIAVGFGID